MNQGEVCSGEREPLVSVQHSKICSQPQIFSWFVINCALYIVVCRGGWAGGVQLTTNRKVSPAQRNFLWYFMENCLTKLVEKKVRFLELDMSKLRYFGRFSSTNWGAFFQYSWKKKRTPIRHIKSKKVRFFLDFEKKVEIIKYFMKNCLTK